MNVNVRGLKSFQLSQFAFDFIAKTSSILVLEKFEVNGIQFLLYCLVLLDKPRALVLLMIQASSCTIPKLKVD